jgi:hypothetical protein
MSIEMPLTSRPKTFTRRQFSAAALATFTVACPLCRAAMADDDEILCAGARAGIPDQRTLLRTSGNPQLDAALAAEMRAQSRFFGISPAFLLYSGEHQNAAASARTLIPGTEGTIFYDLAFLQHHLSTAQWGGTVVAGIIAHEFAHLHQYSTGQYRKLRRLHQTVKFAELHADFISGFFMASKQAGGTIDLRDFFDAFYNLGDSQFHLETHHGTRAERYFAVKGGYNLALSNPGRDAGFAASSGETYLREYFR